MKSNPNLILAWLWILLGFVSGVVPGMFFQSEKLQTPPQLKMKTRFVILCLWSVLLLTGCVVPMPSDGKTYGKVITREQVKFIVPGQTTRAEVTEKLGGQFRASPRLPVLAYAWEKSTLGWGLPAANPPPKWANFYSKHECNEGSDWRAFFVVFDDAGQVSRTKFVRLSGGKSLDEQLENWAQHGGATSIRGNQSGNSTK